MAQDRKLCLIVVDSLRTDMLLRAVADDLAPNFGALLERGTLIGDCVSSFPSVTPVACSSTANVRAKFATASNAVATPRPTRCGDRVRNTATARNTPARIGNSFAFTSSFVAAITPTLPAASLNSAPGIGLCSRQSFTAATARSMVSAR